MTNNDTKKVKNDASDMSAASNTDIKQQLIEMENNWKRALADYKNLQKRVAEEKEELVQFSNLVLISRLLPLLDNLEALERHVANEGVRLIVKEFGQVLRDAGVVIIDVVDKTFDPTCMEAVEMVEGEENKVIDVIQKGYILNDRVIRPARVNVGTKEISRESN